jgi:hypothetical protein
MVCVLAVVRLGKCRGSEYGRATEVIEAAVLGGYGEDASRGYGSRLSSVCSQEKVLRTSMELVVLLGF